MVPGSIPAWELSVWSLHASPEVDESETGSFSLFGRVMDRIITLKSNNLLLQFMHS